MLPAPTAAPIRSRRVLSAIQHLKGQAPSKPAAPKQSRKRRKKRPDNNINYDDEESS